MAFYNTSHSYTLTRFDQVLCASSFPTPFVAGSFSIIESTAGEFGKNQSGKTIVFTVPAGFVFNTTPGTYSATGVSANDITTIAISGITSTTITVRITTANLALDLNTITVNCQLQATGTSTGTIFRSGGNFKIGKSTAKPTTSESLGNLSAQAAMTYTSSTTAQPNITLAPQGTTNGDILQIQVVVSGTCNVSNVTQFNFNTAGSTNASTDISAARVYYTGTTNVFSPTNLFGTFSSPNGSFIITGTQAVTAGTNYFWLTYDVRTTATASNTVDAQCTSLTVGGTPRTPTTQSPTGTRTISPLTQYYSRATGNWNDNTNWSNTDGGISCNCQPNGSGNVFINTNHTITIDANRIVDFVSIRGGAILKDNGTNTVTVSTSLNTLLSGKFTATSAWTINGNMILSGTGASTTTKNLTVIGNSTLENGTSLTQNGASGNNITLKGHLSLAGILSSGTAGGTIVMDGASPQSISNTTSGTISGSGALTLSTSSKTFSSGSILSIMPDIVISGAIMVTNSATVTAAGNITGTLSGSAWTNAAGATIKIAGALLSTGTLTATAALNTVEYNNAGTQSIKGTTYYNLALSQSGTKTFSTSTTVTNMFTMSGSVVGVVGTNTLDGTGGLTMTGTAELQIAKTTAGAGVIPELMGTYNLSGGTITFNQTGAATQTARAVAYFNLKLDGGNVSSNYDLGNVTDILNNLDVTNRSNITANNILSVGGNLTHSTLGSSTLSNDVSVSGSSTFSNGIFNISTAYFTSGSVTLSSGTLSNTSSTIEITEAGGWTRNGGTYTITSGTLLLSGTTAQTIGGSLATTFANLTINNAAGVTLSATTATVTATLTLATGKLITGSNKIIISSTGNVTRTSGYIIGFEQRNIATGSNVSRTFDIGNANNYTPVTVLFTSVSVAGDITATVTASDHPQLSSSLLDGNKSVNLYWTLSNSATTFTNYSSTFTFVSGEKDGSANTGNLRVGNYTSSWSYPTTGIRTSVSTQATGLSNFGDFVLAECKAPTLIITDPAEVCASSTVDLTAAGITVGSTSGLTFTYWNDAVATSPVSTPTAVGTAGTYYINGATAIGCSDIKPVVVTINPFQAVSISIVSDAGGTACSGTTISFTATPSNGGNAPSYQWKRNGSNVGSNSPSYSSSGLSDNDAIICVLTSNYPCITGVNPANSNTLTMEMEALGTWIGANADWSHSANWCGGGIPTTTMDVIVPSGTAFSPVVSGTGNACRNLTIDAGAIFSIADDATLSISGNFINNSSFNQGSSSTLIFDGTGDQSIGGISATNFNNITISKASGTATVSTPQNLINALTLKSGTINANGMLTLVSNASGDARIAEIIGGSITGNVIAQRYLPIVSTPPTGGIYRYFASPVTNAFVSEWKDDFPITGNFNDPSTQAEWPGLLVTSTARNMFFYNEAHAPTTTLEDRYESYPLVNTNSTAAPLVNGKGYSARVRQTTPVTLDVTGTPRQGPVTVNVTAQSAGVNDGWNLIGNPYPAPIMWDNVTLPAQVNSQIAIRDNANNSGLGAGQYVYYVQGSPGIGIPSSYTGAISSGQAFFIKATANTSITFDENDKRAISNPSFIRQGTMMNILRIGITGNNHADETVVRFADNASDNIDNAFDAFKLKNDFINLSSGSSEGIKLAINTMSSISCNRKIDLYLENVTPGVYTFSFSQLESFTEDISITLSDNYTGTTQEISNSNSGYQFNVTDDINSFGGNRFKVHFQYPEVETDLTLTSAIVCVGHDASITVRDSQKSVKYFATINGSSVSGEVLGDGNDIELTIPHDKLINSETTVVLKASIAGCTVVSLNNPVIIKTDNIYKISSQGNKRCGEGSVTLFVEGGPTDGSYRWYETADSAQPIAGQNGFEFITPVLNKTSIYYASAVSVVGCESEKIAVQAEIIHIDPVTITVHERQLLSSYSIGNQWFVNDEIIPGATGQSINVTETGLYKVEVSLNTCSTQSSVEMIVLNTEDLQDRGFDFYPNPVEHKLKIVLPDGRPATGYIQSALGESVGEIRFESSGNSTKAEFDFRNQPSGFYFINIFQGNSIINHKIIKK